MQSDPFFKVMPVTRVLQSLTAATLPTAGQSSYHEVETAGGLPFWRKRIYSALGILTFIYLTTTMVLFYLRRHKISDIQYRPLRLNMLNSFATLMMCVMFCFRTGFYPYEFPCFVIHWITYMGFCLYFSALVCRVISFTWVAKYNIAKLRMSMAHATTTPQTPKTFEGSIAERRDPEFMEMRLMLRLKRFKHYATDEWLTKWVICPVLGFAFVLALVMQILLPELSIRPVQTICRIGSESVVIFIIIIVFLVIICPVLYYFLYGIRDAYGLRNELLMKMISGTISFVMFLTWELLTPRLRDYVGSFMFSWCSFVACHTWSMTLPVWKSYRESAVTGLFRSSSNGKTRSNKKGSLKSKRYELFEKVLADARLFELYKACAAACFCTELILFLKEFQGLKTLVTQCCTPSNRELLPPSTPKFTIADSGHISLESPRFLSVNKISLSTPLSPSFIPNTPCTKSIVETVAAATWIPFPLELRSEFAMFYDTFLDPDSDLSINLSGNLLNEVKVKIEKGQYDLSMYENAREEVLTLLYVNTFERFLKMYGSEVKRKKWGFK